MSALIAIASFAAYAVPPTFSITEIFSGLDGNYQFIRLTETAGLNGQHHFAGLKLTTTHNGVVKEYTFPRDLPTDQTAHLSIVVATSPRLPVSGVGFYNCCYAPDFSTLPSARFLPTENGTIDFAGTDQLTYVYLPSDGLTGLYRDGSMRRATVPGNGQCLVPGRNLPRDPFDCLPEYSIALDYCDDCGTIGPWITGSWFDPEQSGHGLMIQVLPNNRIVATWLAFNPAGTEQAWFSGAGSYSGNTAIIAMQQPIGGRWIPNFNSDQVVLGSWGTLKFTFTDCKHGKVEFSAGAGYGTSSLNLTRLTVPAGLTCE